MGCCQVPSCRSDRIAPRNPSVDVGTTMRPWKGDRKSTRLNSSHSQISYAVFCLKKKKLHISGSRCRQCSQRTANMDELVMSDYHASDLTRICSTGRYNALNEAGSTRLNAGVISM